MAPWVGRSHGDEVEMDGFDVLGVERCHDAGDDATPVSSLDDFDLSTGGLDIDTKGWIVMESVPYFS